MDLDPLSEYRSRHQGAQKAHAALQRQFIRIGNVRLVLAIIGVVALYLALGQHSFSVILALIPWLAFVAFFVWHQKILRRRTRAGRVVNYYANAIDRSNDQWSGRGSTGAEFRVSDHVFADDLDLFGDGSLFQLLSRARTAVGERTLANWLLKPADVDTVSARQEAARELAPRLSLREDVALLGEDVSAVVQNSTLTAWAAAPSVQISAAIRPLAFVLSLTGIASLVGLLTGHVPLFVFLLIFLADALFIWILRHRVEEMIGNLDAPAHDLSTLALLIERLEQEQFQTPCLSALRTALDVRGTPASKRIARLRRWVELLDSSDHIIVRVVSPVLLWKQQLAFAIEHWRTANGRFVSAWLHAIGDFEALSSLGCLAFERPNWTFPQLGGGDAPHFAAQDIRHPLLPFSTCVPNDVSIGRAGTRLLIISGSNMSGKSTLLRSVGLNAVLAWAGAPVCAGSLHSSPLQIGASIRVTDSLQDHRSRFFAEITRLKHVVDLVNNKRTLLFLFDELLSGTNSHDRRIGSSAVVRALLEQGALGVITTHDLALTSIEQDLAGRAVNMHFQDEMLDGHITFDYRLHPGIVTHSNALELMRSIGLI